MKINIEKIDKTELWEYAVSLHDNGEYDKAVEYMTRSADMGEILAQDSLAQYYEKGEGVKQDYIKAAKLYEKVALSNEPGVFEGIPKAPHCSASFALGRLHEEGCLPNSSNDEAIKWYKHSADLGEAEACLKLAELYLKGCIVEQDYLKSFNYLCDACHCNMSFDRVKFFNLLKGLQGNVESFEANVVSMLGECYARGWGCKKDENKAKEFCVKAVELQMKDLDDKEKQDKFFLF